MIIFSNFVILDRFKVGPLCILAIESSEKLSAIRYQYLSQKAFQDERFLQPQIAIIKWILW